MGLEGADFAVVSIYLGSVLATLERLARFEDFAISFSTRFLEMADTTFVVAYFYADFT